MSKVKGCIRNVPYQILPNIIFLLAILGILVMILRHLPEAAQDTDKTHETPGVEHKLLSKGLPAVAISKAKSLSALWIKKVWNFVLEAKDIKPRGLAGYRIRKMFGPAPAPSKTSAAQIPLREANEQDLLEKIKQDPKNLGNYDTLGKFYLEQDSIQDACDIYEYLTKHDPANADYHARVAYCYYQLKNFEKTADHYNKSVALDSTQPNRYYNLGLVLETLGKNDEAIGAISRAIALEPNNARYYMSLSNVCLKLGRNDLALNALEKARQFDPQNEKIQQKLQKLQSQ